MPHYRGFDKSGGVKIRNHEIREAICGTRRKDLKREGILLLLFVALRGQSGFFATTSRSPNWLSPGPKPRSGETAKYAEYAKSTKKGIFRMFRVFQGSRNLQPFCQRFKKNGATQSKSDKWGLVELVPSREKLYPQWEVARAAGIDN
jgi:hypothetical protein